MTAKAPVSNKFRIEWALLKAGFFFAEIAALCAVGKFAEWGWVSAAAIAGAVGVLIGYVDGALSSFIKERYDV